MITDNLSGAKGNTQSSAIIWLSLDPSLSLSGTSQHHPIANPLVSLPYQWQPITLVPLQPPFSCLQHLSPRLTVILFQAIIHYRHLLLLLCRIVTLLTLFCIVFIAILCIVVHCVNCITICVNIIRSNK